MSRNGMKPVGYCAAQRRGGVCGSPVANTERGIECERCGLVLPLTPEPAPVKAPQIGMKFTANHKVRVNLTQAGADAVNRKTREDYVRYHRQHGHPPPAIVEPGPWEGQFHELMRLLSGCEWDNSHVMGTRPFFEVEVIPL